MSYLKYAGLIAAGAIMYVTFGVWWKGLALFVATVLINVGVDEALLLFEKRRGTVD